MVCSQKTGVYLISSPIGDLAVTVCWKGLHAANQVIQTDADFLPEEKMPVQIESSDVQPCYEDAVVNTAHWYQGYFLSPHHAANFSLSFICTDSINTPFLKDVLMTLAITVPAGKTITYSELAKRAGHPGSARAVGGAMATNPFQIIVPCHRVLPKSKTGSLGQYSRGRKNRVKEWLLKFENEDLF